MTQATDDPAPGETARAALLAAALPHVVFDGWTRRTLDEAARDTGIAPEAARAAFPRGGVDIAVAFHNTRDADLARDLAAADLAGMRFRDKVAHAIMRRLELVAGEREAVRRGAALFALPLHAPDGARAIWHTADTIWNALGDTSRDYNWYTKRATLSAVWSASVLYWLGDDTPGFSATREFVHRRVDNVMRFEEVKARLRKNPLASALMRGPERLLDRVRAPADTAPADLPGRWENS
jgi:ubiquinone biosynthesis protein COQ9